MLWYSKKRKIYTNLAFALWLQIILVTALFKKFQLNLKNLNPDTYNIKRLSISIKVIAIIKLTENTHVHTPILIHAVLIMEAFLLNITDSLKRLCGRGKK